MTKNRLRKKKIVRNHHHRAAAFSAKRALVRHSWVDHWSFVPVVRDETESHPVVAVATLLPSDVSPRKKQEEREPLDAPTTTTTSTTTAVNKKTSAFSVSDDEEDDDDSLVRSSSAEPEQEHQPEQQHSPQRHEVSVVCWNVLAESYCSPRSHRKLPLSYGEVVFNPRRRKKRILQILEVIAQELKTGIVCLQEVDMDEIGKELLILGYQGVETPRVASGAATGGKCDSCAVYARSDSYHIQDYQVLRLDDLATYSASTNETENNNSNNSNLQPIDKSSSLSAPPVNSNWQGLQQSFLRRNAALLVRLRHIATGNTFVVANAHLYWNPGYEYVKLCQAHYILKQARQFAQPEETLLLTGDLNSKPGGCTHFYLSNGRINAKLVAPWYAYHHYNVDHPANVDFAPQTTARADEDGDVVTNSDDDAEDNGNDNPVPDDADVGNPIIHLANHISSISLNERKDRFSRPVRYILDATLNKLCRWFRIMGIDAALETEEEETLRTREGNLIIFDRCRKEQRTLITSSTRLMARQNCPPGAYCINPVFLQCLEVAMVHVLLTHGYELDPGQFLSRCVVCNGDIEPVDERHAKCLILATYEAPTDRVDTMEVYQCCNCQQGYWWDDRPTSSASRVKSAATNLLVKCLQAGVPLKRDYQMGIFENQVNVQDERNRGWDFTTKGSDLLLQQLNVVDWLKEDNLACPFAFRSAYACDKIENNKNNGEDNGDNKDHHSLTDERIPFTNVTHDFVSTLDYIFYEPSRLQLLARLHVPTSFAELNDQGIERGHLLPSDVWPSDHLAIGATFSFLGGGGGDPSDNSATTVEGGNSSQEDFLLPTKEAVSTGTAASSSDQNEPANASAVQGGTNDGFDFFCVPLGGGSSDGTSDGPTKITVPPPPNFPEHGTPHCACGCVPAIPSLFEMAERRKRLRAKKEQMKAAAEAASGAYLSYYYG